MSAARADLAQYDFHRYRTERTEAVHTLTKQGLSAPQIADRLGVTERSVVRLRAQPLVSPPLFLPPADVSDERARDMENVLDLATELVGTLRDENPALTWEVLSRLPRRCLQELTVAVLAMVPTDRSVPELLGWVADLPVAKEAV